MAVPAAAMAGEAAGAGAAAGAGRAAAGARSAGGRRAGARKTRPGSAGGSAGAVVAPTASDDQALRSELRSQDAVYQAAYEAGQRGEALGDEATDDQRAAWEAGDAERRAARRSQVVDTARRPAGGAVNDGAGFLLGLVLYALVLNYIQGGAGQARAWVAAKFLNRVPGEQPAAPTFGGKNVGGGAGKGGGGGSW